jgi:hypothetical protein
MCGPKSSWETHKGIWWLRFDGSLLYHSVWNTYKTTKNNLLHYHINFQGLCNTLPQTRWLKQWKFILIVVDAGSPKSRYHQGWFLLEPLRKDQPASGLSPSFWWLPGNPGTFLWIFFLFKDISQRIECSP